MNRAVWPFYRLCLYLLRRFWRRQTDEKTRQLAFRLRAVRAGDAWKGPEEYYARRAGAALGVLVYGLCAAAAIGLLTGSGWEERRITAVERPEAGAGSMETELEVRVEGEEQSRRVVVSVSPRKLTDAQAEVLLKKAAQNLEKEILGANQSLAEVRTDLSLTTSMENGTVTLDWISEPLGVLDYAGAIYDQEIPESGIAVTLTCTLKCQEKERTRVLTVRILPPLRSKEEQEIEALEKAVREANGQAPEAEAVTLPEESGGKILSWGSASEPVFGGLAALTAAAAAAVYLRDEKKLERLLQYRQRQLIMDYPALLYRMAMLLGAGLTIRAVFFRLGKEYSQEKEKSGDKTLRYVYEEIVTSCFELKNGVGEARVYENFGRRCQEARYRRLGNLLSQNLKKGSEGLISLLESEAEAGMEERRQQARKLGEEAGTKLLLPMMLMLILVMGILIVPAILNL